MSQDIVLALQSSEKRISNVLPDNIKIDRFKSTVMMAVQRNPKLSECDIQSLMKACQLAAADGLLVDGRESALVPFKKDVTYIPMVSGLLKKLRQSGDLKSISANVVYENDKFEYWMDEEGPHISHKPNLLDRGEMALAYAVAILKDGGVQIEVMTKQDILKVKSASKTGQYPSGPWTQHPAEMWKKTVLRRICKYLPSSSELSRVYENDNADFEFQKKQEQQGEVDITPPTNESRLDALAVEHSSDNDQMGEQQ